MIPKPASVPASRQITSSKLEEIPPTHEEHEARPDSAEQHNAISEPEAMEKHLTLEPSNETPLTVAKETKKDVAE